MKSDFDVIVVGGGLSGSTLGVALAQSGLSTVVIEENVAATLADAAFDGRGYAIAHASQKMLSALGIWEAVDANCQPILDIKVSDGRPGEGVSNLHVHFDRVALPDGPMGYVIEDRFLRAATSDALCREENATILHGETVVGQTITTSGVSVSLASGKVLSGKLIIGSDGRQSATALRSGITTTRSSYDQASLVCAVEHEKPHGACAHQMFMPSGPLAILPLTGNRSSIVWTETASRAGEIHAMSDADFLDELRPRFGDFLGKLKLGGKRFMYPLGLSFADELVADRVALVGDAAHGIHPLAGQGFNLGLRDIAALVEVLVLATRRGEDIGASTVLARYRQWRSFETASMVLATDSINRLFSNDNASLRLVRDVGLGVVNAIPPAKRKFMRQAAGLEGNLPQLLRGRSV
jgi:2-octaprenyl-6-methoxyphenol hydroxylase